MANVDSKKRKLNGLIIIVILLLGTPESLRGQWLLVPMDRSQQDHLRAYGLTYWTLAQQEKAEWLLNYRGGSFLLPDR